MYGLSPEIHSDSFTFLEVHVDLNWNIILALEYDKRDYRLDDAQGMSPYQDKFVANDTNLIGHIRPAHQYSKNGKVRSFLYDMKVDNETCPELNSLGKGQAGPNLDSMKNYLVDRLFADTYSDKDIPFKTLESCKY